MAACALQCLPVHRTSDRGGGRRHRLACRASPPRAPEQAKERHSPEPDGGPTTGVAVVYSEEAEVGKYLRSGVDQVGGGADSVGSLSGAGSVG